MTEVPLGGSAPDASAMPGLQNSSQIPNPVDQQSGEMARVGQALKEMRQSSERLHHTMQRTARLAGLAGCAALALVAVSAGIWLRSAAHLSAASDVQNAAATALVERIVRLEALSGRVETAVQATDRIGPDVLNRIGSFQEHVDAELGRLRHGLASLQQELVTASGTATKATETRMLAAVADVGIAVAGLRTASGMPEAQPAQLASLVARLEAAIAEVERGKRPATASAARPAAIPTPGHRAARPQRPPAPNPYSFP